ncbi:MAG: hypothetical protein V1922_02920 [bacterium]
MTEKKEEATDWYKERQPIYRLLSKKVESLIQEILDLNKINYHSIQSRCKSQESFENKIEKGISYDYKDMQDMAGVRVIGYVNSDIVVISGIVRKNFFIDEKRSIDKATILGINKVGYRSIHFVSKLSDERIKLPEYEIFKNIFFEIQIRTILQHAWAEIEHDRNYKFGGVLPEQIQRNFSLVAGLLEIADKEFNQISNEIDIYSKDVSNKTKSGNLNIPINSTSLLQYFKDNQNQYKNLVLKNSSLELTTKLIDELKNMEIKTLEDLNKIFTKKFKSEINQTNISLGMAGVVRFALIIHDSERYFEKAWNRNWTRVSSNEIEFLKTNGVNIESLAKKHPFRIISK